MIPPFLIPGDTIGICATARWLSAAQLEAGIQELESWGFRVKVGSHVLVRSGQLAGSTEKRLRDLQVFLDDPECKAIIAARGGYGTVKIIDSIQWTRFLQHPKWICGYSDLTVLLAKLNNMGIAAIHSTMPVSFPDCSEEALFSFRRALMGNLDSMGWENHQSIDGKSKGRLVGGNLSVLYSLLGSPTMLNTKDAILFIEDVDEMLYHVDRMMTALQRAGLFDKIRGVIVGGFTQMKDNTIEHGFKSDNSWGCSATEIVKSFFSRRDIPVAFGMPAGHLSDNRAFYVGCEASLDVQDGQILLTFNAPKDF
jgi:muramoyltetrapeptide carboxypeptidase